jgi:hypothetical protein
VLFALRQADPRRADSNKEFLMTTTSLSLKSWRARLAGAALAFVALAGAGAAQARDVVWSVGVQSPGIALGIANAPPVYVASGPVYYAPPPPVYYAPRPIYHAAPVVVMPPRPGYYGRPYYRNQHRHYDKHRHHGYRDHDRRHGHRGHGNGHR